MKKIKVGIIGLGHIGKNHARVLSELPDADFVAVYDNNPDVTQEIAALYKTHPAASLKEFSELVEAATVATPTPTHFEVAKFLLSEGNHLLVEKPITENTIHAQELADLAKTKGKILQVGHVERFNPVLGALEQRLSHPRFIESHRLSPYPNRSTEIGVVLDLMIHDLEIILHLVRSPVKSIDAVGVPVLSRGEDIANARLRFQNDCVANFTASRISPEKMRKIRVFQQDAYLSLDYQNQSGEIYRRCDGKIIREAVEIEREEPLKRQIHAFLECSKAGSQPKVSGHEATAALALAIEITRLIESQNRVE